MKKFMLMTIAAALIVGCSDHDEDDCLNPQNSHPVEVKASAGVSGIQTKGPVNTGQSITAGFVASATSGDYSTHLWNAAGTFTASATASAAFSLAPLQFYPTDGSTIYLKGYYPLGTLSGNTVTFSETDGSNDVMISGEASGSKTTGGALAFTFNHLLTQLQFTFKAGDGFPASGKNVSGLLLKNQQTPASLNLNNGTVSYNPVGTGISITGPFPISAEGTTATVYPMVKSGATSVVMDIMADGVAYPGVTVNLNTETGKAHNIILTFTPKGITASAIVTPWVVGGTGSSNIQ